MQASQMFPVQRMLGLAVLLPRGGWREAKLPLVIRFRDIKDPIPLLTSPVGARTGWEGFDEGAESHIN